MDNFIRQSFDRVFNIEKIITIFYMEFSKDFLYEGESHNFWEMVYIDKGEMICTADKKQFILKGGELTFHQPNEFHNLTSNKFIAPNVSIITFECKSRYMKYFENKIIKLNSEEKGFLSMLFSEGLSCFELINKNNPLIQQLKTIKNAPFGSSQMTKNLFEAFLIKLYRNENTLNKNSRLSISKNGINITFQQQEILNYLENNIYNKILISDIADALGKSQSSVKNIFAEFKTGGIINYFNKLKIKEAKKLIREKQYNFTEISDKLNFDNVQYFSKCFKRQAKMTPTEYKNSIFCI